MVVNTLLPSLGRFAESVGLCFALRVRPPIEKAVCNSDREKSEGILRLCDDLGPKWHDMRRGLDLWVSDTGRAGAMSKKITKRMNQVIAEITDLCNEAGHLVHNGATEKEIIECVMVSMAHVVAYCTLKRYGPKGGPVVIEDLAKTVGEAMHGAFQEQCLQNDYDDPYS